MWPPCLGNTLAITSQDPPAQIVHSTTDAGLIADLDYQSQQLRQPGDGGEDRPPVHVVIARMPMAVVIPVGVLEVDMAKTLAGGGESSRRRTILDFPRKWRAAPGENENYVYAIALLEAES